MTWTPTIAVLAPRAIPVNLLNYATDADRQQEALEWAGDGNLKLIREYSKSIAARLSPIYPSVAFAQDDDAQNAGAEQLTGAYSVTFEFSVQNANPDTAVEQAEIYDLAFRSMFRNCPKETVLTGTDATAITMQLIETSFEPIKTNDKQNDFLQQFQVRLTYTLWG